MAYEGYALREHVDTFGALVIFLVNALRSIGIPARIAGTLPFMVSGSGSLHCLKRNVMTELVWHTVSVQHVRNVTIQH
jgi:hypothetical protein